MKKLDWIVLIVFLLLVAGTAVWWFFFRNKDEKQIPPPPTTSGSGSSAVNPVGATQAPNLSTLPYGELPLKQGDKNQLVALLQRALNYLGANLTIDGDFGPATKAALQAEMGGAIIVTRETAIALANKINSRSGSANDPVATYIIQWLQKS